MWRWLSSRFVRDHNVVMLGVVGGLVGIIGGLEATQTHGKQETNSGGTGVKEGVKDPQFRPTCHEFAQSPN